MIAALTKNPIKIVKKPEGEAVETLDIRAAVVGETNRLHALRSSMACWSNSPMAAARGKAYPVDSGSATCCGLNDRIRSVAGTTIDGQRAFAFAISGSVF